MNGPMESFHFAADRRPTEDPQNTVRARHFRGTVHTQKLAPRKVAGTIRVVATGVWNPGKHRLT